VATRGLRPCAPRDPGQSHLFPQLGAAASRCWRGSSTCQPSEDLPQDGSAGGGNGGPFPFPLFHIHRSRSCGRRHRSEETCPNALSSALRTSGAPQGWGVCDGPGFGPWDLSCEGRAGKPAAVAGGGSAGVPRRHPAAWEQELRAQTSVSVPTPGGGEGQGGAFPRSGQSGFGKWV